MTGQRQSETMVVHVSHLRQVVQETRWMGAQQAVGLGQAVGVVRWVPKAVAAYQPGVAATVWVDTASI